MDKVRYKKYLVTISKTFLQKFFDAVRENVDIIEKMTMHRVRCHQLVNTYDFMIEFKDAQEFSFIRNLVTYAYLEIFYAI